MSCRRCGAVRTGEKSRLSSCSDVVITCCIVLPPYYVVCCCWACCLRIHEHTQFSIVPNLCWRRRRATAINSALLGWLCEFGTVDRNATQHHNTPLMVCCVVNCVTESFPRPKQTPIKWHCDACSRVWAKVIVASQNTHLQRIGVSECKISIAIRMQKQT